jgi:hypothetical protein
MGKYPIQLNQESFEKTNLFFIQESFNPEKLVRPLTDPNSDNFLN